MPWARRELYAARPATPLPGESSSGPRAATSQGKNRAASEKKLSEIAIIPSNQPVGDDPYIGTTLNGRFTVEKKPDGNDVPPIKVSP